MGVADDETIQRWLLGPDRTIVRAVATAVGMDGLAKLLGHFKERQAMLSSAKIEWARFLLNSGGSTLGAVESSAFGKEVLALIHDHGLETHQSQQLVR